MNTPESVKVKPTDNPTVSVLMPAYNAAPFIQDAIDSILSQTFSDFEFIIIDDGSTDSTAMIIKSYGDKRIRFLQNGKNLGIVRTLNKGLACATGTYLARMDSDDIALKNRLALQVEFMNQNPSTAVVGGAIQEFSGSHLGKIHRMPLGPKEIRTRLLFGCVLMHPTVMFRLQTVRSGNYAYSLKHPHVEDFGLWQAISFRHDLANIPQVLLRYRISEGSITQQAERRIAERDDAHIAVYADALRRLQIKTDRASLIALRYLITHRKEISCEQIQRAEHLLMEVRSQLEPERYDLIVFNDMVARRFLGVLRAAIPADDARRIAAAIQASKAFVRYPLWTMPGFAQNVRISIVYSVIRIMMQLLLRLRGRKS
jgi:glycosyltransferase involved in cell wall biosynthesis